MLPGHNACQPVKHSARAKSDGGTGSHVKYVVRVPVNTAGARAQRASERPTAITASMQRVGKYERTDGVSAREGSIRVAPKKVWDDA